MTRNPCLQLVSLQNQANNSFNLFKDDEIDLTATFQWNGNDVIHITLHLTNIGSARIFRFCALTRCNPSPYPSIPDYVLIHLSTDGDKDDDVITATPAEFDIIDLSKGNQQWFFFKVSDTCTGSYNCEFEGGIPKTKDGTIIISI